MSILIKLIEKKDLKIYEEFINPILSIERRQNKYLRTIEKRFKNNQLNINLNTILVLNPDFDEELKCYLVDYIL